MQNITGTNKADWYKDPKTRDELCDLIGKARGIAMCTGTAAATSGYPDITRALDGQVDLLERALSIMGLNVLGHETY